MARRSSYDRGLEELPGYAKYLEDIDDASEFFVNDLVAANAELKRYQWKRKIGCPQGANLCVTLTGNKLSWRLLGYRMRNDGLATAEAGEVEIASGVATIKETYARMEIGGSVYPYNGNARKALRVAILDLEKKLFPAIKGVL